MPQFNFQARFADAVASGTKAQTVRAERKRRPEAGQTAHLFTGMRTTACRCLGRRPITAVRAVFVDLDGTITLAEAGDPNAVYHGRVLSGPEADAFARADGFENAENFADWLSEHHGLPFEGVVTYWDPTRGEDA